MTEPTALTIRHMKIEDYPLVYGLWTRCTGFTMRDIDDCKDAIKTFLKRNPDTNDFWERQGFAVRDDLVYRELPL